VNRYTDALLIELELAASDLAPRTVYFGGGTPTLLPDQNWEKIHSRLRQRSLQPTDEWTVEVNPATLSLDRARRLRDLGVNRVSLGVQTFDDRLLRLLGRIHDRREALDSFDRLRKAGFENISLDLMFAIPGQTISSWRETLQTALRLRSEHLSVYEVTYEEDTELYRRRQAAEFEVDEDLACSMYDELLEAADAAGLRQYEISNFARGRPNDSPNDLPACACRHNVNYWRGGPFLGLGPSASSYFEGVRSRNCSNTQRYCELLETGRRPTEAQDILSPVARAGELAAFGLRMTQGWGFDEFFRVTGFDLRGEWRAELSDLIQRGWAEMDDAAFRLTRAGLRFADAAAEVFLRP
jgi:oxygen-independent coproporphyrinogen-3 oxidase